MKSPGRRIALFALAVVACVGIVMGTSMPLVRAGESDGADDAHMALEALLAERCALDPDGKTGAGVTSAWCSMAAREISLLDQRDQRISFPVLVAAQERQRTAGYQEIAAELVDETATLFVFPRPIVGAFHMCNVEAPLWIVWYRQDGTPLDVVRMLPGAKGPPARCQDVYAPRRAGSYRYALEMGEGLARKLGLGPMQLATLRLDVAPWMDEGK